MKPSSSHSPKRPAQAMVEFALVLPILLIVIYGLIEVGRLLFIYNSAVNSARAATRYGSTTGLNHTGGVPRYQDCAGMRNAARQTTFLNAIQDSDIVIQHDKGEGQSVVNYCAPGTSTDTSFTPQMNNERVRVTVTTQYTPILNLTALQPFPIVSTSARTILVSVAVNQTAVPMTWDPNEPTYTPQPSETPIPSPTPNYTPTPTPVNPQAFYKSSPANGAVSQNTSLSLTWTTSAGATSYEVCFGTTTSVCNVTTGTWTSVGTNTSVNRSGLLINTTYYWHVRANNAYGTTYSDGSSAAIWSFTTASPDFSKASPLNGATDLSPASLILSWGVSASADSYEYCYGTSNPCTNWTSTGTNTSASLSSLTAGATYYWHVRATGPYGTIYSNANENPTNPELATWSFTTSIPLPGAFNKSAPFNGSISQPTSLTLSWGVSSGATSYEYCLDTASPCSNWINVGTSTSVSVSPTIGTKYYWHVRANNDYGGTTYSDGFYAATWSFTTACNLTHDTIVVHTKDLSLTIYNNNPTITVHISNLTLDWANNPIGQYLENVLFGGATIFTGGSAYNMPPVAITSFTGDVSLAGNSNKVLQIYFYKNINLPASGNYIHLEFTECPAVPLDSSN